MLLTINLLKFTTFQMCDVCLYQCASKPILNRSYRENLTRTGTVSHGVQSHVKKKRKREREKENTYLIDSIIQVYS